MAQPRILIVEDEAIVAMDLAATLRRFGFEVVGMVATGEAAIASAEANKPDLILMDIRLRGAMDGVAAAETIHKQQAIPIIFLTAHADVDTVERSKAATPYGYLVKPFEEPVLHRLIEIALHRAQTETRARDETLDKLWQSEERFRLLVDTVKDFAIFMLDPEGRISSWNAGAERMTGFTAEDVLGKAVSVLRPPENADAERIKQELDAIREHGATEWDDVGIRKDGSRYLPHIYRSPMFDRSHAFLGFVTITRDVTERKQAEERLRESEVRLNEAQHNARIGSWCYSSGGSLTMSDEMYDLYKLPLDVPATYEMVVAAVHPEDRARNDSRFQNALESGAVDFQDDYRLVWPDGQVRNMFALGKIRRDPDGRVIEAVGTVQDVTERKQAENTILLLNADLEQRVQDRTAQLEAANKHLESFSYSVSHDLRSPLRAINGFARMLTEDHGDRLDAEGRRVLGVIRNEASRMGQLIDDLLQFSRLGRQALHKSPTDMTALAREVYEELRAGAPERTVDFRLDSLPAVPADPALLRQVWINLLDNALKFTRHRERAEIVVSGLVLDGEAVLSVADNGAGFDMKYAGKLFGVFQRLHGLGEFEGTGVGLALVERVVDRHGGRVWAEGVVERGATFSFSLPMSDAPAAGASAAKPEAAAPPGNVVKGADL